MANYMAEVAKLLGVEINEEFEVNENESFTCHFTDEKFTVTSKYQTQLLTSSFVEGVLFALIYGGYTIKRKPWKPQDNEKFYVVTSNLGITHKFWDDCSTCKNYYKLGNLYKTEEEAEANREKWLAFYASDEVLEV